MGNIVFANPKMFFLLLLIIPAVIWYVRKAQKMSASVVFSNLQGLANVKKSMRAKLRHVVFAANMLAFALNHFWWYEIYAVRQAFNAGS